MLGLAMKAGKVSSGEFATEQAVKSGSAYLVITYRKLRFVAVMIWLVHSHDRLHRNLRKAADPLQAVPYLFLFPDKLLFIAAVLELTATTCTGAVTLWRDTPR